MEREAEQTLLLAQREIADLEERRRIDQTRREVEDLDLAGLLDDEEPAVIAGGSRRENRAREPGCYALGRDERRRRRDREQADGRHGCEPASRGRAPGLGLPMAVSGRGPAACGHRE